MMKKWIVPAMVLVIAVAWSLPVMGECRCERNSVETKRVCKVRKPCLAALEDCLAYVFDIPLAMLSPITCPIIGAIQDSLDPVDDGRAVENR